MWGLALFAGLVLVQPVLRPSPPGQALVALDAALQAALFRLRGVRPDPAAPVVLAIDAESLALDRLLAPEERQASLLWRQMGPWPWPRALQAELAATVLERGARRVVFNLVLAQPSGFGPADDAAFQRRLAPWWPQLVLAAAATASDQQGLEQVQLQRPLYPGTAVGLTNLLQSPQGLTEAIPGQAWIDAYLQGFQPPLPQALAWAAGGGEADQTGVPIQPRGINYPGPVGTLTTVPAWQLLEQPDELWRGRTVVIGATAAELGGQLETPFGPQSGTEVQAAALASVMAGTTIGSLPDPARLAVLLGWAGLLAWSLTRVGTARQAVALSLGWIVAAVLLAALLWGLAFLWLPLSALLLLPVLAGGLRSAALGWWETRERQVLHQLLSKRMSPALLQNILREPGSLWTQLGGSRTRCVVLFTDLVGFTPLSARLEPVDLFALLNRYFDGLAQAVIDEQGLLDKFIGDSLMAEFGLPRSRGEAQEALAAVRAAQAMQRSLAQLNRELEAAGQPPLQQGIGIHVGDVVAGNLGSSQRMEYTVIGAAVNIASRLEGLTRQCPGHSIVISAEVRRLLPEEVAVQALGTFHVKGWDVPLEVYGLVEA
ncbi:adenylate/guanylate cyclase domain-containing protein [Cyanobium sp. FACHB-13342]|nr:adenylate/guanylate cyclase domain-containing protein [Cyanobium sp. FACHB-13342]MBD2424036.1 adenylate/guanylate cyclase domain-containing protein [Cyanobium sp. FACHB-13342]